MKPPAARDGLTHAAEADHDPARRWPLERKLPLLMTGMLGTMLAVVLALTYDELARSATERASDQLERATEQLGVLARASTVRIRSRVAATADDDAVRRALRLHAAAAGGAAPIGAADSAAVHASLKSLLTPADSGLTVELWTEDGRRIAFAGRDLQAASRRTPQASEGAALPLSLLGLDSLQASDSAQFGELYLVDTVPHFWVVAPVVEGSSRLGYLARQHRIAGGAEADETIRALTGADVASYYRNADGMVWTTISGGPASAPVARDTTGDELLVRRDGGGELLAVEEPISGTPLLLTLEVPMRTVLAAPRGTLIQLSLVSVVLLVVGAVASWIVSRRITRPLVALAGAAGSIARGDYGVRVEPAGDRELLHLAHGFNHMAGEVGSARAELEMQTEEAQALAEELEHTNQELASTFGELEEREAQFRALADAIPQLTWMAQADGSIYWYNARWHEYTGATPEEMEGWGWQSVHDPAMLPEVMERWRRSIDSGAPFEMEFPLRGADGQFRWFLTRVEPVRDAEGRVARWFGTNTEIQSLRDALEAAEAANRAKSDFLAVMSHELRTPLNAIGGYTELIELGLRGPVTEEQRRDLERIRVSQQHLLGLISGVLDLSRIEAGRVSYDLRPVAIDPFLSGLNSLVEPQAIAKSLTIQYLPCSPPLAVLADREKLRQILLNILSNAIRYTPEGGRIELTAEPYDDVAVAVRVSDTGIGIAPEALEHIFEPFVQLDRSLTRVREGIGLGLAISRDLAQGMGGEITVESRPGEGACFTLVLPRAPFGAVDRSSRGSGESPAARGTAPS